MPLPRLEPPHKRTHATLPTEPPDSTREIGCEDLTLLVPDAAPRFVGPAARVLLDLLARHQAPLSDPTLTMVISEPEG